jgi:dinuclear metal center YbgI/SA1388 family protein
LKIVLLNGGEQMTKKTSNLVPRDAIVEFLDRELRVASIEDYSCNGLQVQGAGRVGRVGLAVDASLETYEAAARERCQMLLVHHGMIWGGLRRIATTVHRQLKFLFDNEISLYGAHLPLDLHPVYGNNAQLAKNILGMSGLKPFGNYKGILIGFEGRFPRPVTLEALAGRLTQRLGGNAVLLPFGKPVVRRAAVVSGGGADELAEAIDKGVDCYITGEPRHENYHAAKEAGINVIYGGHYHTEKPGVQAIGKVLEKKFGVESVFLDIETII